MKQKLTYLYVFILTLLTFQTATAQILDKKIKLANDSLTGLKVIAAIKEQAGARFNFGEAINAKLKAPIKPQVSTLTVANALDLIKSTYGLSYEINGIYITLSLPKSPNASAGQGPGTLKGRIVEFETSQPLPGASVYIVELKRGMQSDNDGYYKFTGIPVGKYTLRITYVSYKTEIVQVEAKSGKEETFDVKLQGSSTLNEVVVSSVRRSKTPVAHTTDRQVLEEIKQSSLVVSAISSEQISKTADRNAAQVMQRVSGVTTVDDKFVVIRGLNQRYNLTYLNDNIAPSTELYSRAFALDLIPSRIIDKVLVFKSPGPENQADATGGVVKIYTKDAKSVKHFDMEIMGGIRTGSTFKDMLTYQGGKFDFLGFDDGTRRLPSILPGYGNLSKADISQKQYANAFSPYMYLGQMKTLPNIQVTANYYDSFKVFGKQLSMLSSLSYKMENQHANIYRQQGINDEQLTATWVNDNITNENSNTQNAQLNLLQNFTYRLRDSSTLQFKNFVLQQGQSSAIERVFYQRQRALDKSLVFTNKDLVLFYSQRFLYAGNLGGTHFYNKGKHKLSWNGGYTFSRNQLPDQRIIRLQAPQLGSTTGNPNLLWFARGRTGGDAGESTNRLLSGIMSRTWTQNDEGVYNGAVDYAFRFKPWLSFKAGTFQQWKERKLFRRVYTVHEGDYTGNFSDQFTPPGGYGTFVDPALINFRQQDLNRIWSENYIRDDKTGLLVVDRTQGSDSYIGTEQNNSAYLAFNLSPFNRKIEVYGGLRMEYNRQQIGAAIPPSDITQVNRPIIVDYDKLEILPSLNVGYRPHDSWVIRAAYGKTVNRPEFREVSPFRDFDLENNTFFSGNPTLRSATVSNYDARIEFYPRKNQQGETISVGIFYKDLKNPIERVTMATRLASIPATISWQNATKATIKGIEIEVRKNLDFVPLDFFKRLSVIGNVTLIKSTAKKDSASIAAEPTQPRIGNYVIDRPLQGQAPYIINAGLYYDNASSGTKISAIYNIVGTRIYAAAARGFISNDFINGSEERGSLMELPRHSVDLALSQRLVKSLQVKLSVQNLLNKNIEMAEDYNYTWKYETEKATTTPEGRPTAEGDNIASRFNPGRYFQLSFSYSL